MCYFVKTSVNIWPFWNSRWPNFLNLATMVKGWKEKEGFRSSCIFFLCLFFTLSCQMTFVTQKGFCIYRITLRSTILRRTSHRIMFLHQKTTSFLVSLHFNNNNNNKHTRSKIMQNITLILGLDFWTQIEREAFFKTKE